MDKSEKIIIGASVLLLAFLWYQNNASGNAPVASGSPYQSPSVVPWYLTYNAPEYAASKSLANTGLPAQAAGVGVGVAGCSTCSLFGATSGSNY